MAHVDASFCSNPYIAQLWIRPGLGRVSASSRILRAAFNAAASLGVCCTAPRRRRWEKLSAASVQPLLLEGSAEYSMFEHFKRYPWVLETYRYPSSERLIADLGERVIDPAEKWRSVRGEAAGPTG